MRLLHTGAHRIGARPARPVPNPDEIEIREALSGNICRCTGYGRIVSAVQLAARTRNAVIDEEIAALEDELGDTGSDEL